MDKVNKSKLILTKPFLPPLDEFLPYLKQIWESRWLTNGGSIHIEFEKALCEFLGVEHICLFANGTLALIIALKALGIKGEVITTPFTHISTTQSLLWNNLKPIFVDINKNDFNIDLSKIEEAITPKTTAILPVHVFGNPCEVYLIDQLAKKYNLKVVYDAAHCFGVEINGISICNFGTLSVLSFHATKVFNSFEGGAIICHDQTTKNYIDALKNSGIDAQYKYVGKGLNAKMNEIQAAFGLLQLKYIEKNIQYRKDATNFYKLLFQNYDGIRLVEESNHITYNYSYFPIIFDPKKFKASRDQIYELLKGKNIDTRKYFYPLVSDYPEFEIYKTKKLPIANEIADNILCLPLYHDISREEQIAVVNLICS